MAASREVVVTCCNTFHIPALFQHTSQERCKHRSLIITALMHTHQWMHMFMHRRRNANQSLSFFFFSNLWNSDETRKSVYYYWMSFCFLSTYAKKLLWYGFPPLWHPPPKNIMPQGVEECKHSTETDKREVWKCVCTYGGRRLQHGGVRDRLERVDSDRRWRIRKKKWGEKSGRNSSRKRGNVFSIRSIWCCIPPQISWGRSAPCLSVPHTT